MAYLVRVDLPDVPGALGRVATALGAVGADILAMDIVQRSAGRVVDDLVVDLPGDPPDVLITAAESVDGVWVESVRPDPGVAGAHREWELVAALAADPARAPATLAALLPEVLRVAWAVVLRVGPDGEVRTIAAGGGAPELPDLAAPLDGLTRASRLDAAASWVPEDWRAVDTELAAAPIAGPLVVLVGRPGGPAIRDIELARLGYLAGLTGAVARQPEPDG